MRLPPAELLLQVSSDGNPENFRQSFTGIVAGTERYLNDLGLSIGRFRKILDFGCGVGKFLFGVREKFGGEPKLFGCDLQVNLVDWCQQNIDFAEVRQNGLMPPLPYRDSSFDFVFALSVFTHLSPHLQFLWSWELHRILRPGGVILFTTHGSSYFPLYMWIVNNRGSAHADFHWFGRDALVMELTQPIAIAGYMPKEGLAAQGQLEVAIAQSREFTDQVFSAWERLGFVQESSLGSGQDANIFLKPSVAPRISLPCADAAMQPFNETFLSDSLTGHGVGFSVDFEGQSHLGAYARLTDPGLHVTNFSASVTIEQNGKLLHEASHTLTSGTRTYGNSHYYELRVPIPKTANQGKLDVRICSKLGGPQTTSRVVWQFARAE